MAFNDTLQTRLQNAARPTVPAQPQGSGLDSAQAMLRQVSQTQETNPTQTAQELNQTALALFMVIEYMKAMAVKIAQLEQGRPQGGV